jgi:hypothetical protein
MRAGRVLGYLLSFVLMGSALTKFAQVPKVAAQLAALGFDGYKLFLIAFLEIVSALLFVFLRTRSFGLLMVSAYLGGAIATHVGHNQPPSQPAVVLGLFWLAMLLSYPQTFVHAQGSSFGAESSGGDSWQQMQ